jgi:NSS family neurotransmitter:Na+ symporter
VWTIFGAYSRPDAQLKRSVLAVVLVDTLIAILAGLTVFTVAGDGGNLEGIRGISLLFVSLPVALAQLPASQFVIAVVFLAMVLVVWTTSIALMEPVVGWFREWTGAPRGISTLMIGLAVWFVGLASLLSLNIWAQEQYVGATVFRWLELFTGGLLIPVVAILVAIFSGWCLTRSLSRKILGYTPQLFAAIWFWVMRLVLPVVVAYIGVQYIASSLTSLCESDNSAIWCGQPTMELSISNDGQNTEMHDFDRMETSPDLSAGSEKTLDRPEKDNVTGKPHVPKTIPQENTPKDDDILYHSI